MNMVLTHENNAVGSPRASIWRPSGLESIVMTTGLHHIIWRRSNFQCHQWTWDIYINNALSIKMILFNIVDYWCRLEEIQFVKTRSKRRMFVSFMKFSACWLLHRLIKFNKISWEKRPAKPQPNLRTSFWRRDLKNTQPHLKYNKKAGKSVTEATKRKAAEKTHRFDCHQTKIGRSPNILAYSALNRGKNAYRGLFVWDGLRNSCYVSKFPPVQAKKPNYNCSVFLSTLQLTALLFKSFRLRLHCYNLLHSLRQFCLLQKK